MSGEHRRDVLNILGQFWSKFYGGNAGLHGYLEGLGLVKDQAYSDFIEAANALGRKTVNLTHKQIALPILVKKSERNTGDGVAIKLDSTVDIGPQGRDTGFEEGVVFSIGGFAVPKGYTAYPINSVKVDKTINRITDRLLTESVTLTVDEDYIVRDNTILFKVDPFLSKEAYKSYTEPDGDEVLILWGHDAERYTSDVFDHFGFILDFFSSEPEYYKEAVNAIMDLRLGVTSDLGFKVALASLLKMAVSLTASRVATVKDGLVITEDGNSYATTTPLKDRIQPGYLLSPGEFLTKGIRLYDSPRSGNFAVKNKETLDQLKLDVPQFYLSTALMNCPDISTGALLTWDSSDIIYEKDDSKGNPLFHFDMGLSESDHEIYWDFVWNRCEASSVNMMDLLGSYIPGAVSRVKGDTPGSVVPMTFFINNLIGFNSSIITVDTDYLDDTTSSLSFLKEVERTLPSYAFLFLFLHQDLDKELFESTLWKDEINNYQAVAEQEVYDLGQRDCIQTRWIRT